MSMWSTMSGEWALTSEEADPDWTQSTTACCPRETIPDSCSCPDYCDCMCLDCICDTWGDDDDA